MRGVSTVVVAVLLVAIAATTALAGYSWAAPRIAFSNDLTESQAVEKALAACNDKILETARTGSGSRCVIPASRGTLTAQNDGLYYSLTSAGRLCDPTADWVIINRDKHIELSCAVTATNASIFNLRWRFPKQLEVVGSSVSGTLTRDTGTPIEVEFPEPAQFRTVSVFVYLITTPGAGGQNVDLTRRELTADNVTLEVRIY